MINCELFSARMSEHVEMFSKMAADRELNEQIYFLSKDIVDVLQNGGRVLLCGNGGSASDAQHIAAEFVGRFQKERKAFDAEALTVNTSTLTSVSNDYGYKQVYSRQVEAQGRPGDVFIGISTSGTSENVVEAIKKAKELGMITVMLKGVKDNPALAEICDYIISMPSDVTARIQEGHIFVGHCLAEIIENMLAEE